jgi:hypothetical protein
MRQKLRKWSKEFEAQVEAYKKNPLPDEEEVKYYSETMIILVWHYFNTIVTPFEHYFNTILTLL